MKLTWIPKADASLTEEKELAAGLHALSHPARVRLLRVILGKRACAVGELSAAFPLAPSTISQHLKVLRDAGLIEVEVRGPKRVCRVRVDDLERLKRLVNGL